MPAVADHIATNPDWLGTAFLLPTFRAAALPWAAATAAALPIAAATDATATDATATDAATTYVAAAATDSAATYAAAAVTYAYAAIAATTDAEAAASAASAASAAATASAASAANAEVFEAIEADAQAFEDGHSLSEIRRRALWRQGNPSWVNDNWAEMKLTLLDLGQDWQVWTDWYEDRLRGQDDPWSRPLIEELERERCLIHNDDWEQGAKHVNAIIAELDAKYRAEVPKQRLATIEVEYREDGLLHRRPSAPPKARDADQDARLRSAWAAHAEQLASLEALEPGRNSPALDRAIRSYRAALGESFDRLDVISLGVHGSSLEALAARADSILLEDTAGALVGMAAAHGLFIRQFDAWRAYLEDASGEPTNEILAAGVGFAQEVCSATEIVADDVADPLKELADSAEPPLDPKSPDQPPLTVKRELLLSIGNVLSGLFSPLLAYAREAGAGMREGSLEGIKDFAKQATLALAIGGTTYVAALAAGLPGEFGWIIPVIAYLKMKLGK